MTNLFESEYFDSPKELKNSMVGRLKGAKQVTSLELLVDGKDLEGAKEFSELLISLRRQGVKISHQFSIRMDFPRDISKEKTLELLEYFPKPKNGHLKIRLELGPKDTVVGAQPSVS